MTTRKTPETLRSRRWLGPDDLRSFGHRSGIRQMGYDEVDWTGRPVIGILNTWSGINPCHAHFPERVEWVKRGVLQADDGCDYDFLTTNFGAPVLEPDIH